MTDILSHPISDEAKRFLEDPKGKFRIGGYIGQLRSSVWTFSQDLSNRPELYIAQESTAKAMKISLHQSGHFRLAFHENVHRELVTEGSMSEGSDRAFVKWKRPPPSEAPAKHVLSIVLPSRFFSRNVDESYRGKMKFLIDTPAKSALEVGIFHSPSFSQELEGRFLRIGTPMAYWDFGEAGIFSIIVRYKPFDPNHDLPPNINVPASSIRDPNFAPTDDVPVRSGLGVLLINDAAKDGVLHIIEAGGVSLRKNLERNINAT